MQYRQLGTCDLKLPVVTFGAWAIGGWMWGGTDDAAALRAIDAAIDAGITCIDTAPTYGMGHSERIVGKAIAGKRDKVLIATKCGVRWDLAEGSRAMDTKDNEGKPCTLYRCLRPNSIRHECEQSLRRLSVDEIDLYQCHWPDPTTPIADSMGTLLALQQEGKIRHIGVSNYSVEMMETCLAEGNIVSNQPKYNALERDIEADILPFCCAHNVGILAYSPIAQGLLTGAVSLERRFAAGDARADKPLFKAQNRAKILAMLEKVRPIADGHGATLGQLFTAWLLVQPGMTSALVGARTAEQVIENAKAAEVRLAADEVQAIRSAVEELGALT